jgi:RNA polymerase sigma-70 factor (ECF subfamily)
VWFVRAWLRVGHGRPAQPRFDTWLHGVALNLCRDRLRRRAVRREEALEGHADAMADPGPTPEQQLDRIQRSARVAAALDALPPRQREALVLHYHQALPQAEAAALMGVSVDALESLLARARRGLRARLLDRGEGPSADPGGFEP